MTSTPAAPRAVRPADGRVIGGVCAGVSAHLHVPVWWVRIAFAVATLFNGAGIIGYAILWRFMPLAPLDPSGEVRTHTPGRRDVGQTMAIVAIMLGVWGLGVFYGPFDLNTAVIPVALLVVGVAVVWRLVDDATLNSWIRQTSGPGFWIRLASGVALVAFGLVFLVAGGRPLATLVEVLLAVVLALVGLGLLVGPWAIGLWRDLQEERRRRARSEAQADVAAHLHDSVLQTLALLQKNAKDPVAVAAMARRQERELREWLFGDPNDSAQSFATGLREASAETEDTYRVPVEVITVGDLTATADTAALVAAAREAMVNAAKHAGADRIDVYAEVGDTEVEVFVRDRGRGFDPADVPADRHGIAESIRARMERHGGAATLTSATGTGTEVRLSLPHRDKEKS